MNPNFLPFTRGIDLVAGSWGDRKMYGLRVAYIGSQASNLVEVDASTGDLTFSHGAAGAEAVDATVGTAGVIDVSDSDFDTIGEVAAEINRGGNWYAVYADLPPSFVSTDVLTTRSAAAVGGGTLLEVDPAKLGVIQASKTTLAKGLGLESATDLDFDMKARDRRTHPDKRHRAYRSSAMDSIYAQITGTGYSAANSGWKVVRLRTNPETEAVTEETIWGRAGVDDGVAASGTIVFADNPTADDTITLNGVVYTFTIAASSGTGIQIQLTLELTLDEIIAVLNASGHASIVVATYTEDGVDTLTITYDTVGEAGNAYTLAASADTPSAATLEGGAEAPEQYIPTGGGRDPLCIGNRGEQLFLVWESTDTTLPTLVSLTVTGEIKYHEGFKP